MSDNDKLDRIQQTLDQKIVPLLEQHNKILFGNGNPGIIIRVDRLENLIKYGASIGGAVWGGIVLFVSRIWR